MPLSEYAATRKDLWNAKHVETLQHRHYAVIAGIIASMGDDTCRRAVCLRFLEVLSANPRFDRQRFIAACGGIA